MVFWGVNSQLQSVWFYVFIVIMQLASSTWYDLNILQNNPRIWLRTLPIALLEEEPKILDFVLWLNYFCCMCHVLSLFLHFSLLWLSCSLELWRQPRESKRLSTKQDTEGMSLPPKKITGLAFCLEVQIIIYNHTVEIYKIVIHMLNSSIIFNYYLSLSMNYNPMGVHWLVP